MPEPSEVVVAVGSNIRPAVHVPRAIALLREQHQVLRLAPIYETPPIDRPEQASYWNTAVLLATNLRPGPLREDLRAIERTLGRIRTADRFASRTIDLDVIWRDGAVVDPDVATRPFLQRLLMDLEKQPGAPSPPDAGDPAALPTALPTS